MYQTYQNYFLRAAVYAALTLLPAPALLAQLCGPQTNVPVDMRYDPQGAEGDFLLSGITIPDGSPLTTDAFAVSVREDGTVVGCAIQASEVMDGGQTRLIFNNVEVVRAEDCYAPTPFGTPPPQIAIDGCEADSGQDEGLQTEDQTGQGNYEGFYFIIYEPSGGGQFFVVDNGGQPFDGSAATMTFFSIESTEAPPAGPGDAPATTIAPLGTSYPTFADAIASLNGSLPVELAGFSGEAVGKQVRLNWATLTESGNEGFLIERQGQDGEFVAIGEVAGAGDSRERAAYEFFDVEPLSGTNFYRLRQVDFSGVFSLSDVIGVTMGEVAGDLGLSVYPNPARGEVTLKSSEPFAAGQVVLRDGAGRVVRELSLQDGEAVARFSVDGLLPGVYQLSVIGGQGTRTQRLVVQ